MRGRTLRGYVGGDFSMTTRRKTAEVALRGISRIFWGILLIFAPQNGLFSPLREWKMYGILDPGPLCCR